MLSNFESANLVKVLLVCPYIQVQFCNLEANTGKNVIKLYCTT